MPGERLLFLLGRGGGFFLHPFPKLLDGPPQGTPQLGKLAGAEDQKRDAEDEKKLWKANVRQVQLLGKSKCNHSTGPRDPPVERGIAGRRLGGI